MRAPASSPFGVHRIDGSAVVDPGMTVVGANKPAVALLPHLRSRTTRYGVVSEPESQGFYCNWDKLTARRAQHDVMQQTAEEIAIT